MLRDYVMKLYVPAARAGRALDGDYTLAAELAAWKGRVRAAWSSVRVDHTEVGGVGDVAEIGSTLELRAFVSLGDLGPDDVDVQVVHGRVDEHDEIGEIRVVSLREAEAYEAGRYRFDGEVKLERSGPFGYTVRVVPRHRLLATPAELGLAALPPAAAAMSSGPLR
jgi:starch phosphorylase